MTGRHFFRRSRSMLQERPADRRSCFHLPGLGAYVSWFSSHIKVNVRAPTRCLWLRTKTSHARTIYSVILVLSHLWRYLSTLIGQRLVKLVGTESSQLDLYTAAESTDHLGIHWWHTWSQSGDRPSNARPCHWPQINFFENENSMDTFPNLYTIEPFFALGNDTKTINWRQVFITQLHGYSFPGEYWEKLERRFWDNVLSFPSVLLLNYAKIKLLTFVVN